MTYETADSAQVVVRAAGLDDWRTMRDVRLRALRDAPDAFSSTLADESDRPAEFWRERLATPGATTFLAFDPAPPDGSALGLVTVLTIDTTTDEATLVPATSDGRDALVVSVWVAPEARGRGVADALLHAAGAHARDMGARRAVLDVGDHNDVAIRLYTRHGFVATGRRGSLPAPREHVTEHELALDLTSGT